MSISLMIETNNEIRRLLIAGSELAVGDFRLKKLLPQMRKAGEAAPVFARVADVMEKVIEPGSEKISDKLLELANIVNAVLYTQGQTDFEGTLEDIEPVELRFTTTIPYRRLKPVTEALTATGSGRLKVIREAYTDGVFKDLRLINPLIHALDDNYPDIAELASDILEEFGPSIIPILKDNFNFKGGKGYARRIDIISKLAGRNEKEFILKAVEEGADEVRVSAVRALKYFPDPEYEPMLLKLSKERKKEIREASLFLLALLGSEAAIKRLSYIFDSKGYSIVFYSNERYSAVYPIKISNSDIITRTLLDKAEEKLKSILEYEQMLSQSSKSLELPPDDITRNFAFLLDCMEGKKDPKIFEFLNRCLEHEKHLKHYIVDISYPAGTEYSFPMDTECTLAEIVAKNLLAFETNEAFALLDSAQEKCDNCILSYSFEAAVRFKDPKYVFNHYALYAKNGRKSYDGQKILGILDSYIDFENHLRLIDTYTTGTDNDCLPRSGRENIKWDPRWLTLLIDLDETKLVCRLASGDDAKCIEYLLNKLDSNKDFNAPFLNDIVLGLMQAHYFGIMEVINRVLDYNFKEKGYFKGHYFNNFAKVLRLLPSEYGPVLENFASFYDNEASKKLVKIAHYIKRNLTDY